MNQSLALKDPNPSFLAAQEVNSTQLIQIQLSWEDLPNEEIDLDLQCVLLNELGQIEDVVFYNQRQSKNKAITLSEDSVGTESNSSETLNITLQDVSFDIKYLAILVCSFKGQPLRLIETNKILVTQQGKSLQSYQCCGNTGTAKSSMSCLFQRQFDGKWGFTIVEEIGEGKNFNECEDLIKKGLVKGGFDEILFMECKNWKGNKQFVLSKNQAVPIPDALKVVSVGLGWDTKCDVDSSVLLFDSSQKCLDKIFFGNTKNSNGSVIHHGDNLTGEGEGDDEVITIDLQKLPNDVKTIWAVMTIYSQGFSFKDVSGAFCRLFSQDSQKEFCIFNLSEQSPDKICNGNIMCCITRCKDSRWTVSPKGYFTRNTTMACDLIPIIQQIQSNIFTKVVIVPQKIQAAQQDSQIIQRSQSEGQKPQLKPTNPNEFLVYQNDFQIEIQNAKGLGKVGNTELFNAFVSCKLNQKKIKKTQVIENTLNPVWNFKFREKLTYGDTIEFKIKSKRFLIGNKYLGTCFYEVKNDLFEKGSLDAQLQVKNKDKQNNPEFSGTLIVRFVK